MTLEIENYDVPLGGERQYVVKVEDLEHYVKTLSTSGGFKEQYGMLRMGPQKPSTIGMKTENKPKNRYNDLLPYDENRVVLTKLKNEPHSDYINASYIDAYRKGRRYICTQGPLDKTITDFWRMIWQEDVNVIAMTANIIENGKKKCEKYWPDKSLKAADLVVTLQNEKVFLDFTIRTFKIVKVGVSGYHIVRQYQYTAWPDHGVPSYPMSLINMFKDIQSFQKEQQKATPWVLHCSAGIGRSGTVMVLDYAIDMSLAEGRIDVLGILYRMRQERLNLIETVEQYTFVYRAILEYHFGDNSCKPANAMVLYFNKMRMLDSETKKTGLEMQFEKLRKLENPYFQQKCLSASTPAHKNKNRDPYIIPPDDGRPVLKTSPPSNYINAVYAYHYGTSNHFVATQYPLPSTIADFWQLLWDTGSSSIVVLNEFPNKDESCPIFWPQSGSVCQGGNKIQHVASEAEYFGGVLTRKFSVKNQRGKTRTVKTFHLHGWRKEDFIPPQVDTIVTLIAKVEKWTLKNRQAPVLVTCYDGSRASGFYCAASYLAGQIHATHKADVVQAVRTVRLHRPSFIPTVVSSGEDLLTDEVPLLVFRVIGCTVVTLLVGFTIIIYVTSGMFHIDCLAQICCECCIFTAYMLILLTTTEPFRINIEMCLAIAIFLHFSFVGAAFFLLLETICMSQARFAFFQGFMQLTAKSLFIAGWICPAITTAVSAIIWSKEYTTRTNCWLDVSQSPYWPTMIPLVGCAALQAIIVLVSLCMSESTSSLTESQYKRAKCYRTTRWASVIITGMLSLSWFFGVSAYHTGREDFYGAFTISSILLGVSIFILRISTDDEMREKITTNVLCCLVPKNRVLSFHDRTVFTRTYTDKLMDSMKNLKLLEGQNGTVATHK